jgi:stage II sporulation protein D
MMTEEPKIRVGILVNGRWVRGRINGTFRLENGRSLDGPFSANAECGRITVVDSRGRAFTGPETLRFVHGESSTFTLSGVRIGIRFHWEREQEQTFRGDLELLAREGGAVTAVNEIALEDYLESVIASEMSAAAPLELLKAHAVTSRSWIACMLKQEGKTAPQAGPVRTASRRPGERIIWYGREEHDGFDVCADDHCQRYQGVGVIVSEAVREAVRSTRGICLVYGGNICDARYHKACGGMTENYENVWEDTPIPYLSSVSDAALPFPAVRTEKEARQWICGLPDAYCNKADPGLLRRILPSFDQETADFFRWKVVYPRDALQEILREKTGIDCGVLHRLTPLKRGPSGRIIRMKIEGSKGKLVVGKELEIRRCLSRSHLYSSAFAVSRELDPSGTPVRFILDGAGWGHGVGLCQIGAAVMADRGFSAEEILRHYFRGATLRRCY